MLLRAAERRSRRRTTAEESCSPPDAGSCDTRQDLDQFAAGGTVAPHGRLPGDGLELATQPGRSGVGDDCSWLMRSAPLGRAREARPKRLPDVPGRHRCRAGPALASCPGSDRTGRRLPRRRPSARRRWCAGCRCSREYASKHCPKGARRRPGPQVRPLGQAADPPCFCPHRAAWHALGARSVSTLSSPSTWTQLRPRTCVQPGLGRYRCGHDRRGGGVPVRVPSGRPGCRDRVRPGHPVCAWPSTASEVPVVAGFTEFVADRLGVVEQDMQDPDDGGSAHDLSPVDHLLGLL